MSERINALEENHGNIFSIQIEYSDLADTVHLSSNFEHFETLGESFMAGIETVNVQDRKQDVRKRKNVLYYLPCFCF